ncbi:aspartyl/asparaginyl beta-hydroxylase [Pandoravirus japonicus]|uniref:Aspartyl/asparaginyl beta-hydroxylase n=1 Tax=Pandoravirus japonicus TaxID=2823154 RepID=A0A811BPP5_9VIRU|nr:aspartyl/asparaginyl beta-hydroxylase [Pandoravirus japonicus]
MRTTETARAAKRGLGVAAAAVVALALALVAALVVLAEVDRRRGRRVRCRPVEYYRLGSWLVAPYNVWVAANAQHAPASWLSVRRVFPGGMTLRAAWRHIAAEAARAMALAEPVDDEPLFRRIAPAGRRWKRFGIRWYGDVSPRARAVCPVTCALLDALPEVRLATFSILDPGAVVIPHRGPFRGALRYHLGLSVPPEADAERDGGDRGPVGARCRLVVDGQARRWAEGDHVLFDDTYVHEVRNLCDRPRIVLFCDVERPMRTARAQAVNAWVCSTLGPLSTRANDNIEQKSGGGDRH